MMMRGHHHSIFVCSWIFLYICTSCCLTGPASKESTPCTPCQRWEPPCQPKIDVLCPDVTDALLNAEQLIDIALTHNPETRVTWARARAASYQLQAVKSSLYPTVDAEVAYAVTYQNFQGGSGGGIVITPEPGIEDDEFIDPTSLPAPTTVAVGEFVGGNNGTNQLISSDISASYLLWDFGGRSASIQSARQSLQMANWMHNRNIQSVMINVLVAYYAYLDAKALLDAQEDDLKDAETNLEAATELYNAGVKTRVDMLQAQSQFVNTQLIIQETKGLVKTEMGNLANALGVPANTPLNVANLPEELPMDDILSNIDTLMETAKSCRPDLSAYQAEYQKRQADLKVAESDGKPFLTANADLERVDGLNRSVSSGYVYSGAIALEFPLYHGCYFSNRRREAKSNVAAAFAALQTKESDVLLEVWRSYYSFQTAVQTFKYSEEFLKYTEETYEAALGSYKEGIATILDVLSAQKALSRARAQIIQSRTQWVISLAGIAYATGTL